mmetsp:Transcript_24782/g.24529  ORF Transcript_24782/g.24529 Transcript_24782/m.24529 type:complete len:178 (-) Transcript_24782:313-846(-)
MTALPFTRHPRPMITPGPMVTSGPNLEPSPILAVGSINTLPTISTPGIHRTNFSCDFPLKDLLRFHKNHGREGTIVVTKVEDPSRFGVVVYDDQTGKIDRFVEKPKEFVGDRINAGLYILSNSVIEQRVHPRFMMIETDVFPQMAVDGQLYCFQLEGYWADIGQPKDYLKGMSMHLN